MRNDIFDANNWFNDYLGQRKPPLRQNQFGYTFGGPVLKDKLFFFTSYEAYRQRKGQSVLFTVPTAEQRSGDFSRTLTAAGALIRPSGKPSMRPSHVS